ncbi:MAG: hypothetical protein HQK89_00605 [Nitrospirae bacterium]|nr:hypothetical protein [Nitrospirota bacterium]
MKENCWQFKRCGREPGGHNVKSHDVCPAAANEKTDGVNNGDNGGRNCWTMAGSFSGKNTCTAYGNLISCMFCDFFKKVEKEEGSSFILSRALL